MVKGIKNLATASPGPSSLARWDMGHLALVNAAGPRRLAIEAAALQADCDGNIRPLLHREKLLP